MQGGASAVAVILGRRSQRALALRSAVKAFAAISLVWHLAGCGNAYETLALEPWKPAGTANVPREPHPGAARSKFTLTPLTAGDGAQIGPGSLVHARILGKILPGQPVPDTGPTRSVDEVWFWIGDASLFPDNARLVLGLGSADLRAAFIGARNGSRLSLAIETVGSEQVLRLPVKGFLLNFTEAVYLRTGIDTDYVTLTSRLQYEIDVLKVCSGALLQRRGVLKQWGYIPHLWADSESYPFAREGILEWAAIEARCGSPEEKARLEKGPAHRPGSGLLSMWPQSYRDAVSRGRVSTRD